MSRNRQTWFVLLLAPLYPVMVKFAEDHGYISAKYNVVHYVALAVLLIFLAIEVRRGRLVMPKGFFVRPARGPILFGLALVLGSVVWLAGGVLLFGGNASYGTLIPFFALLLTGLMMVWGGLWYKLVQWMLRGK